MEIRNVSLKNYSSLHIGGSGDIVIVTSTIELVEVVMYAKVHSKRIHILGEGTNTFFGDGLKDVLVIKLFIKGISFEERDEYCYITASSGESWDDIVLFACDKKLWGIENLSAIPGTVGAAPVQNIGAYGVELKDVFVSLSALDRATLNIVEIDVSACYFGYRSSLFKHEYGKYIIISVTLKLSRMLSPVLTYKPLDTLIGKSDITPHDVRGLVVTTRKTKLPDYREYPNAGSFFKNPVVTKEQGEVLRVTYPELPCIEVGEGYKIPAAWLIERVAHMKGVRTGNVGTWPNQPLVIVNYGEADASEVITFSQKIIDAIKDKTGIVLEREVNCVL